MQNYSGTAQRFLQLQPARDPGIGELLINPQPNSCQADAKQCVLEMVENNILSSISVSLNTWKPTQFCDAGLHRNWENEVSLYFLEYLYN